MKVKNLLLDEENSLSQEDKKMLLDMVDVLTQDQINKLEAILEKDIRSLKEIKNKYWRDLDI